jgi:HlyD family secretion protein
VGESDIGSIIEGQQVRFTVQTYPNEHFIGTVRQVRLQSKTVENVVNYTVVIEVANPDGRLLPGMTANVDFLTGSSHDVLLVSNAALRFRPTEAMLAEMRENRMAARGANGSTEGGAGGEHSANGGLEADAPGQPGGAAGTGGRPFGREGGGAGGPRGQFGGGSFGGPPGAGAPPGGMGAMFNRMRAGGGAVLWHVDDLGKLSILPVHIGLTDGQRTEVKGEGLAEGMSVIIGTVQAEQSTQPASPFQSQPTGGGSMRFRPGGF